MVSQGDFSYAVTADGGGPGRNGVCQWHGVKDTPSLDGGRWALVREWSRVGASPDPAETPLVGAPFILTHAAPDTGVLPALHGPLQAGLHHRATQAHALGLF